jgi:hypothetical protein
MQDYRIDFESLPWEPAMDVRERGRRFRDNLSIEKFPYFANGRDLARCFRTYVIYQIVRNGDGRGDVGSNANIY